MQDQTYIIDDRDSKKLLFKKRSTSSTCAVSNLSLYMKTVYILIIVAFAHIEFLLTICTQLKIYF